MRTLAAWTAGLLARHATAWQHSGDAELKHQLSQNDYTLVAFRDVSNDDSVQAAKADFSSGESADALLPEWEAVQGDAALQSVDCSASRRLCADMDVASLPAIRLYRRHGPVLRYRGPRKASRISAFLRRAQRPVVTQLANGSAAEFASADAVVFIAQLSDAAGDTSLAGRFASLAAAYHDRYSFGVVHGVSAGPSTLQCRNNDDSTEEQETELDDVGALEAFVAACAEPLVPELSRRTELKYMQVRIQATASSPPRPWLKTDGTGAGGKSLVYYFSADEADREAYAGAMRPLAKRHGDYLRFVTVDSAEYPDLPRALGVASAKGLAVEDVHTGQAFPYRGGEPATPEAVERFLAAVSEGRVEVRDSRDGGDGGDGLDGSDGSDGSDGQDRGRKADDADDAKDVESGSEDAEHDEL